MKSGVHLPPNIRIILSLTVSIPGQEGIPDKHYSMKWSTIRLVVLFFAPYPVHTISSKCHLYFAGLQTFFDCFLTFIIVTPFSVLPPFPLPASSFHLPLSTFPLPNRALLRRGCGEHNSDISCEITFKTSFTAGSSEFPMSA